MRAMTSGDENEGAGQGAERAANIDLPRCLVCVPGDVGAVGHAVPVLSVDTGQALRFREDVTGTCCRKPARTTNPTTATCAIPLCRSLIWSVPATSATVPKRPSRAATPSLHTFAVD
jgi:hypothetical protein